MEQELVLLEARVIMHLLVVMEHSALMPIIHLVLVALGLVFLVHHFKVVLP